MFNGFDDFIAGAVQENNITVLAHDFDHEADRNGISNFVFIGDTDFKNPVVLHLLNPFNDSALKIFAHNHNKGIGKGRIFKVGLGPLDPSEDRMGREQEFLVFSIASDLEHQFLLEGLVNFLNAATQEFGLQFLHHMV